jgi:hypothetical protein
MLLRCGDEDCCVMEEEEVRELEQTGKDRAYNACPAGHELLPWQTCKTGKGRLWQESGTSSPP